MLAHHDNLGLARATNSFVPSRLPDVGVGEDTHGGARLLSADARILACFPDVGVGEDTHHGTLLLSGHTGVLSGSPNVGIWQDTRNRALLLARDPLVLPGAPLHLDGHHNAVCSLLEVSLHTVHFASMGHDIHATLGACVNLAVLRIVECVETCCAHFYNCETFFFTHPGIQWSFHAPVEHFVDHVTFIQSASLPLL